MTSILQACCSTLSKLYWRSAGFTCLLLVAGCGDTREDQQLDYFAFGTEVTVSLFGVTDAQREAADARLQEYFLADVGPNFYPWRPGLLHDINDAIATGRSVAVPPRLASIIRRAAEIETRSNNTFNAGLGNLTELWGLHDLSAPPQLPNKAAIAALLDSNLSVAGIRWNGDEIVHASDKLMLDLGGIAKGAILNGSVSILREFDVENAIVNIGGDLIVLGSVNGRPARIGIRSPLTTEPVAAIQVVDGETVVTSGNYERFVEIDDQRYTHVLDPRTGYPVEHTASVTVVHSDAMLADAAATALMVGGPAEFDALVEALDLEFALLIDSSGDLRLTPAMDERLDWLGQTPKD